MTSTVSAKDQTVVPKQLREQFGIEPGATLDWHTEGHSIRVVKLAAPGAGGSFLNALRKLGRVPASVRDRRPVVARRDFSSTQISFRKRASCARIPSC